MRFVYCKNYIQNPTRQFSVPKLEVRAIAVSAEFLSTLEERKHFPKISDYFILSDSLVSLRTCRKSPHTLDKSVATLVDSIQSFLNPFRNLKFISTCLNTSDLACRAGCRVPVGSNRGMNALYHLTRS